VSGYGEYLALPGYARVDVQRRLSVVLAIVGGVLSPSDREVLSELLSSGQLSIDGAMRAEETVSSEALVGLLALGAAISPIGDPDDAVSKLGDGADSFLAWWRDVGSQSTVGTIATLGWGNVGVDTLRAALSADGFDESVVATLQRDVTASIVRTVARLLLSRSLSTEENAAIAVLAAPVVSGLSNVSKILKE